METLVGRWLGTYGLAAASALVGGGSVARRLWRRYRAHGKGHDLRLLYPPELQATVADRVLTMLQAERERLINRLKCTIPMILSAHTLPQNPKLFADWLDEVGRAFVREACPGLLWSPETLYFTAVLQAIKETGGIQDDQRVRIETYLMEKWNGGFTFLEPEMNSPIDD